MSASLFFLLIRLCQFSDDNSDQQGQQRQHERTLVQYKCCFRCPCCRKGKSRLVATDGEVRVGEWRSVRSLSREGE